MIQPTKVYRSKLSLKQPITHSQSLMYMVVQSSTISTVFTSEAFNLAVKL